jgi:hypothetical protein
MKHPELQPARGVFTTPRRNRQAPSDQAHDFHARQTAALPRNQGL